VSKRHVFVICVAAAAALVSLSACSANPSANPTASPSAATPSPTAKPSGWTDTLSGITVTGAYLKEPKVAFKSPFVIDQTRTQVLKQGTGATVSASGFVAVQYYGVDGRDGKMFDQSYGTATPAEFPLQGVIAGFQKGLTGQKVGSRVLIAMPGSDAYDSSGGSGDGTILVGDTLVFVVDIVNTWTGAQGKTVTPPAGLPTVTDNGTSTPTVTIPKTAAPTAMVAQTLIEGDGPKVTSSSTLITHYVGYSWNTGQVIDDHWSTLDQAALNSSLPGFQTGLVGKTERSRVLLVLPPKDGFPEGSKNPPVTKGDTVVYVVDILMAA